MHGIFHRALVREFTSMGLLVFSILLGIVVFSQLIRLLGDSVSGVLAVDGVLALLGFSALNYLPVLLSISLVHLRAADPDALLPRQRNGGVVLLRYRVDALDTAGVGVCHSADAVDCAA